MKKQTILIAVVSLFAATAAYILWPLPQSSEPSQNDSEPRMPSLLAAGSGATASNPVTTPAVAAAPGGPTSSTAAYADYLEHKETLRALAHKATSSNDPAEIEMAKLYLQRCLNFPKPKSKHPWIESPDAMRATAPMAAAAFERFQAFCSDVLNQRDRNLLFALNGRLAAIGAPVHDLTKKISKEVLQARVDASLEHKVADLLITSLRDMSINPDQASQWLIGKDIVKRDELAELRIPGAFASLVIPAVVCEAWGCDESVYRMRLCGSGTQCSDEAWKMKLNDYFEGQYTLLQEYNPGTKYPSWAEARERVLRALQR